MNLKNFSLFLVFIQVTFLLSSARNSKNLEGKNERRALIGGKFSPHRPFFVRLATFEYAQYFCGGKIIRKDFVLTAAHCVEDGELFFAKLSALRN